MIKAEFHLCTISSRRRWKTTAGDLDQAIKNLLAGLRVSQLVTKDQRLHLIAAAGQAREQWENHRSASVIGQVDGEHYELIAMQAP